MGVSAIHIRQGAGQGAKWKVFWAVAFSGTYRPYRLLRPQQDVSSTGRIWVRSREPIFCVLTASMKAGNSVACLAGHLYVPVYFTKRTTLLILAHTPSASIRTSSHPPLKAYLPQQMNSRSKNQTFTESTAPTTKESRVLATLQIPNSLVHPQSSHV